MQLFNLSCPDMFFVEIINFLLATFPNCLSNCTFMNFNIEHASWGLQSPRSSSCVFYRFCKHCTVWTSGKYAATSTPGNNCLECFPLVSNFSRCRMTDFEWFRHGCTNLPRLLAAAAIASLRTDDQCIAIKCISLSAPSCILHFSLIFVKQIMTLCNMSHPNLRLCFPNFNTC